MGVNKTCKFKEMGVNRSLIYWTLYTKYTSVIFIEQETKSHQM